MSIERNFIITILKLTKDGSVLKELINKEIRAPSQIAGKLLKELQNDRLIYLRKGTVEADTSQRLKLAIHAMQLGADVESVSNFLQWHEFENVAAIAFQRNGYSVAKNLRFTCFRRRWEIDVLGCKKPIAVCVDCKHWHHGMYPSKLAKVVEEQSERTFALAESLQSLAGRIECASWDMVKLIPAVLSLLPGKSKFHDNVPIIPILQLQDFLTQLPAYADSIKHFRRNQTNFQSFL